MAARTIVIADDEPYLLQIVAYNLRKAGAMVHTACNGQECLDLAIKFAPDLIVSDYQMPVMDGFQACVNLSQNPATANIPVIMLTARGHRLSDADLARTHIVAMLAKPFSAKQLVAKIEEILAAPATEVAA